VQITWIENYRELGRILGLPLVDDPDMALIVPVAVAILFEGMTTALSAKGDFTGRDLSQYFNAKTDDPMNARRIINGTDKAMLIAGYHEKILKVLQAAVRVEVKKPVQSDSDAYEQSYRDHVVDPPKPVRPELEGGGIAAGAGAAAVVTAAASDYPWWQVAGLAVAVVVLSVGLYFAIQKRKPS
jgi:hypothetical protein